MRAKIPIDAELLKSFVCPACSGKLRRCEDAFACLSDRRHRFPIREGVPVLLDEDSSIFQVSDTRPPKEEPSAIKEMVKGFAYRILPDISLNLSAKKNIAELIRLLHQNTPDPAVLILGGRVIGDGISRILMCPTIRVIESDVIPGPRVGLICDAHRIPFEDATFDGVIVQAVLEHTLDPQRCVAEIHRVLKSNGCVYAETPFMQQVHMGRHDFTRFTLLGHRRLFRDFQEISSGMAGGPGTAMAWSIKYFILSFVRKRALRFAVHVLTIITTFWLKYFDYYLVNNKAALDAASGYYCLGRKSDRPISDGELVEQYRGGFR